MRKIIPPGGRSGTIRIPASKSMAHRYLIAAALSGEQTEIICPGISRDIMATIACLNAMGESIAAEKEQILVRKAALRNDAEEACLLPCGESGSTLRFLLPVAGATRLRGSFRMEGRLPARPMEVFEEELRSHGMNIRRNGEFLHFGGALRPGDYSLPGNISSQYFSGLFFALPLLEEDSRIHIRGDLESADYLHLTEAVLKESGIRVEREPNGYRIAKGQHYHVPARIEVEGDYSNAAFFLCAGALLPEKAAPDNEAAIRVLNLKPDSGQGDRRIIEVLRSLGAQVITDGDAVCVQGGRLQGGIIDASMIPDLIPVLSVVAAGAKGETRIINGARLRLKESDRIRSTVNMLKNLGADVTETEDGMIIRGREFLRGGEVDACADHRIAMSAAVASVICREAVTVTGAECVEKSYPAFWTDFASLHRENVSF